MWVDQVDIRPSEHWDRAVEKAVRDCRGLVVILSPRSVVSDNVADEISFAIENRKAVLPVMFEKCSLPLRITRMNVIDASANYERAVHQCATEIQRISDPEHPLGSLKASSPIESQIIATLKSQLASIIGPIAGIIVEKASTRASNVKELISLLTQHIDDPADRIRFTALVAARDATPLTAPRPSNPPPVADSPIASAEVQRIGEILIRYLGPLAPVLAKRESQTASSIDHLKNRLADLIPDPDERVRFLKALKGP